MGGASEIEFVEIEFSRLGPDPQKQGAMRNGIPFTAVLVVGLVAGLVLGLFAARWGGDDRGPIDLVDVGELRPGGAVQVSVDQTITDVLTLAVNITVPGSRFGGPTSVWVTIVDGEAIVFVNRSPERGCAVLYVEDVTPHLLSVPGEWPPVGRGPGFFDPCAAIVWGVDGEFLSGHRPVRRLDRLPSWVEDGIVMAEPVTILGPGPSL